MKKEEKTISAVVIFYCFLGLFLSYSNPAYFSGTYTLEDGFLEWGQFTALILSSGLLFYRASMLCKKSIIFYTTLFAAFVFLVGALEEISWGQRLFAFNSSAYFYMNNSQQEFNFHNLVIYGVRLNKLIFGLGLTSAVIILFLIIPIVHAKNPKWAEKINALGIPVARVSHIILYFLVLFSYLLIKSGKRGEVLEFGGVWIFYLLLLNPKNILMYDKFKK